jgi:hypothetical protein
MDEIAASMVAAPGDAAAQRAGCVAVFELCKDLDAEEVLQMLASPG